MVPSQCSTCILKASIWYVYCSIFACPGQWFICAFDNISHQISKCLLGEPWITENNVCWWIAIYNGEHNTKCPDGYESHFNAMAWNSNGNKPLTYINLKFNRDAILMTINSKKGIVKLAMLLLQIKITRSIEYKEQYKRHYHQDYNSPYWSNNQSVLQTMHQTLPTP